MKREEEAECACPPVLTLAGDIYDNPGIHPWAAQFKRDLQIVVGHPEAESFAPAWSGGIRELIWDPEVTDLFLAFDPKALRTACVYSIWRPPVALAGSVPAGRMAEKHGWIPLQRSSATSSSGRGSG
eukprot:7715239-Pyramimonas_sp.AAC.1